GQPLHAFDYDALKSQTIHVRRAHENEKLVTLDKEERSLSVEDIVITNGEKPVALAGVMGGLDSEITEKTTTVALESAVFDPAIIRQTSQRDNVPSESSARVEKGIKLATVDQACDEAAALISQLTGGQVLSASIKASQVTDPDVTVKITLQRINDYLG